MASEKVALLIPLLLISLLLMNITYIKSNSAVLLSFPEVIASLSTRGLYMCSNRSLFLFSSLLIVTPSALALLPLFILFSLLTSEPFILMLPFVFTSSISAGAAAESVHA